MKDQHVVLAVDDDPDILAELADTIRSLGYSALTARNQVEAQRVLQKHRPCLALLDLELKTDNRSAQPRVQVGFNLLGHIRKLHSRVDLPIILVTGHAAGRDDVYIQALRNDANDLVRKPFKNGELETRIRESLSRCPVHAKADDDVPKNQVPDHGEDIKTSDVLHFAGRPNQRRRSLIRINGRDGWVRATTFELLWRLALPLWQRRDGWMKADKIADGDNPYQAIKRAREDLKPFVKDPKQTIENNGNQYRLSTLAAKLTYDVALMRQYFSHLLALHPKHQTNRS